MDLLVCRACLACNVPVYNIINTQYQNVFEGIAAVLLASPGKPHALCAPCLGTVHKIGRLQEKSRISEGILHRLIKQGKLTGSAIEAVNRRDFNLADTLPIFSLEPMKVTKEKTRKTTEKGTKKDGLQTEKSEEHSSSSSLSHLSLSDRDTDKVVPSFHTGTSGPELGGRQLLEDPVNNVMVKIEPDLMQSPENANSSADLRNYMINEPCLAQSSNLTDIAVKTEPMEMQDYVAGTADLEKGIPLVPPTQSDNTISIDTIKLKEMPYIQIDGELLGHIKSEVDSDEINGTGNIPGNDNLVEINVQMNQPIDIELREFDGDKNNIKQHLQVSTSSKGDKVEEFKGQYKVDGRRIKTVSKSTKTTKSLKIPKQSLNTYKCSKCDYQTPHQKRFTYHTKRHTGFVMCAMCDYKCASKSRLISHLRVHTKERPFICKICNKGFSELGSLSKHLNIHNGVKPFKCTWCEYKAGSKNHLDRHVKRHTGDKRFKCELCEYACVQNWDLKRHVKTHENERTRSYKRVAPVNPIIVCTVSTVAR